MRAHDRKPQSRSRAVSRLRFWIQLHLGWLRGGPGHGGVKNAEVDGIPWLVIPAPGQGRIPESLVIDRERIRRTSFQRNKLAREYPRALPEVVGDVEAWRRDADVVLAALKGVLHDGLPLPGPEIVLAARTSPAVVRRWRQLRAAHPELRPALDAMAWRAGDRRHADRMIEAVGKLADRWQAIRDPSTLAMLVELLAVDGPKATVLLEMFADPDLDLVCDLRRWDEVGSSSDELHRRFADEPHRPWPELPHRDGRMRVVLRTWLEAIYGFDARGRSAAYALLKGLWPGDLGRRWARHLARIEDVRRRSEIWLAAARTTRSGYAAQLEKRSRSLRRLAQNPPPLVPEDFGDHLLRWLRRQAEDRGWAGALAAALKNVPAVHSGVLARMTLLCRWSRAMTTREVAEAVVRDHVLRTARFFRRHDPQRALRLWQLEAKRPEVFGELVMEDDHHPLDEAETRDHRWRLLGELCESDHALEPGVLSFVACCTGQLGKVEILPILDEVVGGGRLASFDRLDFGLLQVAVRLCAHRPDLFLGVYDALVELDWDWSVKDSISRLEIAGHPSLLAEAILAGQAAAVARVALYATQGKREDVDPVILPWPALEGAATGWCRRYPRELRPALRDLAGIDPQAEASALGILRRDFPDRRALQEEIDALTARIDGGDRRRAHLEARRERLRARLTETPVVSSRRLANYLDKIRRRTMRVGLAGILQRAKRSEQRELRRHLDQEQIEWCLEDERSVDLLPHLLRLNASARRLALRLLGARSGPPPWDLRDAPENLRYRRKLRQMGLDLTAWLSSAPREATGDNGAQVTLALEADPLEVLTMGKHFTTCLAPGDFNFFAAVANAADVNKQVLYARDRQGQVVGRRLLALNEEGGMLIFYPYAHDSALGFDRLSGEFVESLCASMGTGVAMGGEVARLLSPEWYDDGAHRLQLGEEWLAEGGALFEALPEATPDGFLEILARHAGDDLDAGLLRRVLGLLEVQRRVDLVGCLLPWLRQITDPQTLCLGARIYRLAGLDGSLLLRRIPPSKRLFCALDHSVLNAVVREYVELDPSYVLRILRWTRGRDIRSWADECCFERVFAAARAHERMHRLRTALGLYRAAKKLSRKDAECARRIRVLRKVVGDQSG